MITYLCGGINGLADRECMNWREIAKSRLTSITIDPMRRDYRGIEAANVHEIVTGDLADMVASDAVLVNASRPSWGTAMELVYAHQCRKLIVGWTDGATVSPWLRFHCTELFESIYDAISYINERA